MYQGSDDIKDGMRAHGAYPVQRDPRTFGFALQCHDTRVQVGFCPGCGAVFAIPNDREPWRLLRCDWCLWSGPTSELENWVVYDPHTSVAFRQQYYGAAGSEEGAK